MTQRSAVTALSGSEVEATNSGLLIRNHLSYLDILVLGAAMPCVFVAKREVRHWPVFGWFAWLPGTVFIRRDRRKDLVGANQELRDALRENALVVLFAEGTTSGGDTVLPFKSSLLASVTPPSSALWPGFMDYSLENGSVSEEVCSWRDMTLVPHLINLPGKRGVTARVAVALHEPNPTTILDRKALARQLHAHVLGLQHQPPRSLYQANDPTP